MLRRPHLSAPRRPSASAQAAAHAACMCFLAELLAGCNDRGRASAGPSPQASAPPQASTAAALASPSAGPRPLAPDEPRPAPLPSGPPPALKGGAIALDGKPIDIATGAFVGLGAVGAVVRRRDDEILLIRLGEKPTSIADDGKLFSRTRTLVIDHGQGSVAYWVNDGKLLRRAIDVEGKLAPVETLAADAADGYAPAGLRNEGGATATAQDVVAYVARKRSADGDRRAKVWVEGKGALDLCPDGSSGASAVAVAPLGPGRLAALWLDARTAMTPVHALPLELDGAGEPRLGAESTVWNAPPSELLSSVSAVKSEGGVVALLAVPKNGLDFGLAGVPIAFGGAPLDSVPWLDYPNGLDPAPVVSARFCGLPAAVIVRPTARPIDAPRSVEIVTVEPSGRVTPRLEVAQVGRVDHLAAWASPRGDGWIAWAGDGRTKVRRVRCGK